MEERVKAAVIFAEIRARVEKISGLEIQIAAEENGPPSGKDINLRVTGPTYEGLFPVVDEIRNFIEFELGGTIDVEDGRPSPGIDWSLTVDRTEAAKYGLGIRELGPYVQLVTDGVKLGTYLPDDSSDELDIQVRLPRNERSFDSLDSLRVATPKGQVPVSNFITRTAVPKVGNITRQDGFYSIFVGANVDEGVLSAEKVSQVQAWVEEQNFPSQILVVYGGAAEQTEETNAFMIKALTAAMFIIFLVLLLEYNSFYQVFVTLSTVVMSTAGVLLGMLITGMTFSAIMTGLGIVALSGIVVKNGIVLIDTYNHYTRDDGVEPIKAMLLTTAQRVRPVLLTAAVTTLGVIPMALNIELDFPLREVIVGGLAGFFFVHLSAALVSGLLFSTVLTLVMVPVMITAPSVIGARVSAISRKLGLRRKVVVSNAEKPARVQVLASEKKIKAEPDLETAAE
ncbi:MAG: efflux RND transporter permease subunit [Marinosulfonomonas sp.]|nr:efflux RND transporter permease subunit [Marinosulfonomonas sp.]